MPGPLLIPAVPAAVEGGIVIVSTVGAVGSATCGMIPGCREAVSEAYLDAKDAVAWKWYVVTTEAPVLWDQGLDYFKEMPPVNIPIHLEGEEDTPDAGSIDPQTEPKPDLPKPPGAPDLKPKTEERRTPGFIVLTDDEALNLRMFKRMLDRAATGNQVVTFHQPMDALHFIQANPTKISCIVTDFNMKTGMSGADYLAVVKANGAFVWGGQAIVSAHTIEAMREESYAPDALAILDQLELGAITYMHKPFKGADLTAWARKSCPMPLE